MFVLRNIEARSWNLYCSGKATSIAQPACFCSLRYPASKARAPYCLLYTASFYYIFPHYLINGTIFVKTLLNTKRGFRVSLQLSSETFFILRRTERDMTKKCVLVFMSSTLYSGSILMKVEFSRQIVEKYSNIHFHENPSSGSRVFPCGRTDRQTWRS
jgi:hypothetical protein